MHPYRCLLVDDEPPAIALLEKYISHISHLEIAGKCHSGVKAFDLLQGEKIDLLFLDIRMPVLNGIDFLKTLKNPPAVILTTAYREYALDGYELDIIDYLLKPIAFDRFLKAIDRYQARRNDTAVNISASSVETPAFVFFNINKTHHKVYLQDIHYLESLKDYVRLHTSNGPLVVKGNIGIVLDRLPKELFVRTHRSFAVALQYVTAYNQTEVEIGGERLPLRGNYRDAFLAAIERN